jgi:hypothetical protein
MTELLETIKALISSPTRDLDTIERTLTDGYAHALTLEAERVRLERRLAEAVQALQPGDPEVKTVEVSELARLLRATAAELVDLRRRLRELRSLRYTSPERTA